MNPATIVETRAGDIVLPRRGLTVTEFRRMGEAGILGEDDRIELVEGELIEMSPIGSRHASVVDELNHRLSRQIPEWVRIRVQNPLRLGETSELQPDLALVRARRDRYASDHPAADAALLVIEVADTSGGYDRGVKVPLYARAGVPEAWLVDLATESLERFREPTPEGYADVRGVAGDEMLSPAALPTIRLTPAELLAF